MLSQLTPSVDQIIELQELIVSTEDPSSEYNSQHPAAKTDCTVYPPPTAPSASNEPTTKKRKTSANGAADATHGDPGGAVYAQQVVTNQHIRSLQEKNRKEYEEMVSLCVGAALSPVDVSPQARAIFDFPGHS